MTRECVIYDEDVNYDELEQHSYGDAEDDVFYTCPICHEEYIATFMTSVNGETMCIDCWSEKYNK